jgi:arylsulfatase A-like enzyme
VALLWIALAAWLAGLGVTRAAAPQPPRQPNILFLVADEYRHDCLGVAGHPIVKTPNLDRLAQQGIRFTHAYVASPVCSPSRATLFTGRYPQIHGVIQNNMPLNPGEVALPEMLKSYGYATAMAGKLHLPPDGWFDRSWITAGGSGEEYQAFLKVKVPNFSGRSNTAAVPETLIGPPRTPLRIGTSLLPENLYEEAWVADRAIEFLEAQKASRRPWFLYVSMLKPHSEFVIPKPYDKMFRPDKMPLPATFHPGAKRPTDAELNNNDRAFINDADVLREVIAHYYGAVSLVDKHMGRVLETVDRLGMSGDTIVVFTADHGNMLGERNRMFKGVMYESSARVPLLLRAPGRLPRGKVVDAVLDNSAVMPTLLDLAGLPVPAGVQGRSLAPLARGEQASGPGMAFSVLRHRMVCDGEWKLIDPYKVAGAKPELYHVARDPDEQRNLYGQPDAAATQRRLEAALQQWWSQKPPPVTRPAQN